MKLWQDLKFAVRVALRNPAFTGIVIVTLGLGIGANAAIFNLLDQVLLRRLPVQNPDELVVLDGPGAFQGMSHNDHTFSYPMFTDFRDKNDVFSGVLARMPTPVSLSHNGSTERINAELVSGEYFHVLGITPAIGRLLTPDDDRTPGGHPVVALSHGFWVRRFGGAASILNQTIAINGIPMTVVGVTPPGFHGVAVGQSPDLFTPMMMKAQMTPTWDRLFDRRARWLNIMARLKPGMTRERAEVGMNVLYRQINELELKEIPNPSERFRKLFTTKHLDVLPGFKGQSDLREQFSTPLVLLMAMVGLVLLIACANVANLLLARAAARQREIAIRLAIGASRADLVRQLVVESVALALCGGAVGLLFASWTGDLLLRTLPFDEAARSFRSDPDIRVIFFTLLTSLAVGIVFGLAPALQSTRPSLTSALKDQAAATTSGSAQQRFRKSLVVAQVSLSLLLLIGAGLFARSLYNLRTLNPGFTTEALQTLTIDPSLNGYSQARIRELYPTIQRELAAFPGVSSVSIAQEALMTESWSSSTVKVEGYTPSDGEDMNPIVNGVAPGFFATLGIPLLSGRDFTDRDGAGAGAPKVVIINEQMAHYYFKDANPIGRHIGWGRTSKLDMEIVGVVKDNRMGSMRDAPRRFVYYPYLQDDALSYMTFYVRTHQDNAALGDSLRRVIQRVDPNLPVYFVKSMKIQVNESLFLDRLVAGLSACFGLLATLLASIGLYGVMSYSVARRTREIGIRMALGAQQRAVLWLVMRETALMAGVGIAAGLPAAVAASRLVRSQLFGLSPTDPVTLALATGILALVALVSGYVPALRAARVDPMIALRYE